MHASWSAHHCNTADNLTPKTNCKYTQEIRALLKMAAVMARTVASVSVFVTTLYIHLRNTPNGFTFIRLLSAAATSFTCCTDRRCQQQRRTAKYRRPCCLAVCRATGRRTDASDGAHWHTAAYRNLRLPAEASENEQHCERRAPSRSKTQNSPKPSLLSRRPAFPFGCGGFIKTPHGPKLKIQNLSKF
jgi:hypothetical protein